jgi:RND family efflux transporter MFP subunit
MSNPLSQDLASLRIRRDDPPARKPWGRIAAGVALVVALGGAYVVGKPAVEASLFKTEVAITEISSVSPAQASVDVTSTGYVIPQRVAKVAAKVIGRVSKVNIQEGQAVKAGDIIFELDPADQKSAVLSAQARVAAARARVQASRATLAEAQLQWERQKRIVESGAGAPATAEDLGARVRALEAQVAAADAEVASAQAEVSALSVNLRSFVVAAPIDGTALGKPAQVGDVVNPGMTAPLVELADFSTLLVESDVPEGRLHLVKNGGPCEIVLDAIPGERFRGEVVDVSPRLNRSKATATVKVKFLDPPDRLRPEMSARVSFLQKPLDEAQMKEPPKTIVPASALVDRNGGRAVFVVDAGKVRLVPVTVGDAFGTGFVLKSGPAPGARVVKDPPPTLADGQSIKERSS